MFNTARVKMGNARPQEYPVTARFLGEATMATIRELVASGQTSGWFSEGHGTTVEFRVTKPELLGQAV